MRIPWFHSGEYKKTRKKLRRERYNVAHLRYALWPRAIDGFLVWLEPYMREREGEGFFIADSKWTRHIADYYPKLTQNERWCSEVKSILWRNYEFFREAKGTEVFVIWPRTCELSGQLLCLRTCTKLETYTSQGVPDTRYVDSVALSEAVLKGQMPK